MKFLPSSSAAHDSLHHISWLLEERLKIEKNYSGQVEQWLTSARSISTEDPCSSTISALIHTTDEDLFNRRQQEASLRSKLDDVKRVMKSFDNLFDPIRNRAATAGQHESGAQQAQVEAKARYVAWVSQKDGPSLVRRTIFRDVFRQDSRKRFDEASRNLKKRCSDLHAARLHFTNHLSGDADSLAVCYQDIVERIKKFISMFAEWQQSVAGTLNANGAKLWHSANAISGAPLASQFLEVLWEESNPINPNGSICYALSLQNEYPILPKCFGFPLSQYSCPRETQLVVSLLKGLLQHITGGMHLSTLESQFESRNEILEVKVKIEQTWGTNSDEDQCLLSSLSSQTCLMLFKELLKSFPEPILNPDEVSRFSLQIDPMELPGPARNKNIDKRNLLVVASVHGHPQGDILQAIHDHVVSHGWLDSEWQQTLRYLLTHRERWLEGFPHLIQHYSKYITLLSKISVVQHPLEHNNIS